MRQKIAAGNWKMNTDLDDGLHLASAVINMVEDEVPDHVDVILIPPFTHLTSMKKLITATSHVSLGAQNCNENASGAFTGEISVSMLKSVGVDYVVIGHSERRALFGEKDDLLKAKIDGVLGGGLTPIFCCGEELEVRNAGDHFDLVSGQVENALFHLDGESLSRVVIAYEPVWAIGTGVTASSDQAQEMHKHIREEIAQKYNDDIANNMTIVYGGSVKAGNATELFKCPDVDGGLIGGASLEPRGFVDIAKSFP